jgi:rubrerythrin
MKKYLIPILLGVTILSTSIAAVALSNPVGAFGNNDLRNENFNGGYRGGMMGGFNNTQGTRGGMMGGYGYQMTISTDLTGSAYDEASLKAALDVVLSDEFKARAEYEAIVEAFGNESPYVQLINAETNHVNALTRIYTAFGFAVPADNGDDFAVLPSSLESSYQIGIDAETANIALYEGYLKTDLPSSVERIFENLQRASENHLAIFTAYKTGDTTSFVNGCPMFDNDND